MNALVRAPYTAALGETRKVSSSTAAAQRSSTVSFGAVTYSVPHTLADETVWVRVDGDHLVVTHCAPSRFCAQSRLPATSVRRLGIR